MQRIKDLNCYQKGILIIMIVMTVIFSVLYPKTIARVGYRYHDAILVPTQENGNTLYSGKINGQQACFTVSDNTVVFQYGDKTYGTYTIKKDPTAIPKDNMGGNMTGIEVLEGNKILFRGGVMEYADSCLLFNEDGTLGSIVYATSDGIVKDANGNPIDRLKPTASVIYQLTNNPKLEHKGHGRAWFGALFICILNTVSILFADELFRINLLFQIRDVEQAEPSDWEILGRYIGWTVVTIGALAIFITGLQ